MRKIITLNFLFLIFSCTSEKKEEIVQPQIDVPITNNESVNQTEFDNKNRPSSNYVEYPVYYFTIIKTQNADNKEKIYTSEIKETGYYAINKLDYRIGEEDRYIILDEEMSKLSSRFRIFNEVVISREIKDFDNYLDASKEREIILGIENNTQ